MNRLKKLKEATCIKHEATKNKVRLTHPFCGSEFEIFKIGNVTSFLRFQFGMLRLWLQNQ